MSAACEHGYERGPSYCPFCRRAGAPAPTTNRLGASTTRKEQGQQQAWTAADEAWKQAAMTELLRRAASGERFTSEDITNTVGLPSGDTALNRNNAVGALIGSAVKRKQIVEVAWVRSTRPTSNGARLGVYVGVQFARKDGAA